MPTKYPHSKKKSLAKKIEKLSDKKSLKEIKKIIFDNNPELDVVKKSSCILMFFHNLNDKTYRDLETYLKKKILKECAKKVKNINEMESAMSADLSIMSPASSTSGKTSGSRKKKKDGYKLSTKEKNLIRRKKYEKQLNEINGTETLTVDFEDYNVTENASDDESHDSKVNSVFVKKN